MNARVEIVSVLCILLLCVTASSIPAHSQCAQCCCNAPCAEYWYWCCELGIQAACQFLAQCTAQYCQTPPEGCSSCFDDCVFCLYDFKDFNMTPSPSVATDELAWLPVKRLQLNQIGGLAQVGY